MKYHFKVEWVLPMVFVSILPQAEFGRNDHWQDAPHFIKKFKGSTINRFASDKEKKKDSPTLKDIDFDEFFPSGINLEKKYYDLLKTTTKNDTLVLQECNIFDYSFLLAIVKPTNQKIIEGKL